MPRIGCAYWRIGEKKGGICKFLEHFAFLCSGEAVIFCHCLPLLVRLLGRNLDYEEELGSRVTSQCFFRIYNRVTLIAFWRCWKEWLKVGLTRELSHSGDGSRVDTRAHLPQHHQSICQAGHCLRRQLSSMSSVMFSLDFVHIVTCNAVGNLGCIEVSKSRLTRQ